MDLKCVELIMGTNGYLAWCTHDCHFNFNFYIFFFGMHFLKLVCT
jgi:hypothetical protein